MNEKIIIPEHIIWTSSNGRIAIFSSEIDFEIIQLEESAFTIWTEISKNESLNEVIKKLSEDFEESEEIIKKEVIEFVDELILKGVLQKS